ncbi:MAG TPA: winged helix-turn-helix domain-containing protein [Gemmatimonadaceae bacterium]|nr:winged helix-turn-helix domain-containing protein [Gemmatimonadaceae bacterium]
MHDTPDIAAIAKLIGDHARSTILMAMMTGRALTATELARVAGVSKPTASSHLSKLVDAKLVAVEQVGRHRYFRLANHEVGTVIETLVGLAHRIGSVHVPTGPVDVAMRKARVCYDHLAGDLGVLVYDSLRQQGCVRGDGRELTLTDKGDRFADELGVDLASLEHHRRPLCLACLDWSVRRPHLAGALGAALAVALLTAPLVAILRKPPPYTGEPFKPVFAYVQAHRQPGDRVYVYSNAFEAINRYGAQYGVPPGSYVAGSCDEQSILPFLADIDRLRGTRRLWVIGSSVPDFRPARLAVGKYLRAIGVKRDSMSVPSIAPLDPVSAELFDLSDTMRLRLATAASIPFTPDTLHALCFDWVYPTATSTAALPR